MEHPVFSYHLQHAVFRRMSVAEFARALGYQSPHFARSWLAGESLPPMGILPAISRVLNADPLELLMVWVADASIYYEPIVKAEVLDPRGSKAKLSADRDIYDFRIDERMLE